MLLPAWIRRTILLAVCLVLPAALSASTHRPARHPAAPAKAHKGKPGRGKQAKPVRRARGQQQMEANRVRQIQAALIREHYLEGEPSSTWDERTKAAMQRYQADQGWQTKRLPDARALIKLGLGPSNANLMNPDTASITLPDAAKTPQQPQPERR